MGIAKELSRINFKGVKENKRDGWIIFCIIFGFSVIYTFIALYFMHWLWYHYLTSIFSGLVFGYIVKAWYFEKEKKKLLREVNEFLEAFSRCYESNHGNMEEGLKLAMERGTPRMKRLMGKIEELLKNEGYEYKCEKASEQIPLGPLKSFISILVMLKGKGRGGGAEGEDLFLKAFQQLSFSVGQEILRTEKSELDNKGVEVWILLAPIIAIPGTHLIYLLLFQSYFDVLSSYNSLEAKSTAAFTFLFSSLGAIFVNWIRKNR